MMFTKEWKMKLKGTDLQPVDKYNFQGSNVNIVIIVKNTIL